MARPDSLIEGNCYFYVNYSDEELRVPVITTIRYVERMNGKDEELWVFEPIPSVPVTTDESDSAEPPLIALDESQISRVLDLADLQRTLTELAALAPAHKEPPAITLDELMRKHQLAQRIGDFLASSHRGLTIRIRYTDHAMFLDKDKDGITAGFYPHPLRAPEENSRLESIFKSLGIAPCKDYLADNGRTRILGYRVNPSKVPLTELCGRVFVEVYNMKSGDKLEYALRD